MNILEQENEPVVKFPAMKEAYLKTELERGKQWSQKEKKMDVISREIKRSGFCCPYLWKKKKEAYGRLGAVANLESFSYERKVDR